MSWLERLKGKITDDQDVTVPTEDQGEAEGEHHAGPHSGPLGTPRAESFPAADDDESAAPPAEMQRPLIMPRRPAAAEPAPEVAPANHDFSALKDALVEHLMEQALLDAPMAPIAEAPAAQDDAPDGQWPTTDELMQSALESARAGDYESALAIWEPLARDGHGRAQNNIGACFIDGLDVERDYELARRWLELSAESGDPVGRRNLAMLTFKGDGGPREPARAAELFRLAAEEGDAPAQDSLSWMLLNGEGVTADPLEAKRWAEAAAKQGVAAAMTRLGMIAHEGLPEAGIAGDPEEAAGWWRKAADAGDADGQAMLGAAHHFGAGVTRDRLAAYAWLLRAQAGHSALAHRFMEAVEASLSPEEKAAAERRAAGPLAGMAE